MCETDGSRVMNGECNVPLKWINIRTITLFEVPEGLMNHVRHQHISECTVLITFQYPKLTRPPISLLRSWGIKIESKTLKIDVFHPVQYSFLQTFSTLPSSLPSTSLFLLRAIHGCPRYGSPDTRLCFWWLKRLRWRNIRHYGKKPRVGSTTHSAAARSSVPDAVSESGCSPSPREPGRK